MARWSEPVAIWDIEELAPKLPGVYEVGFARTGKFERYYIGKSDSRTTTIRARLIAHRNGNGNPFIADYMRNASRPGARCHLRCRWFACDLLLAAEVETNLLSRHGWGDVGVYVWNGRG